MTNVKRTLTERWVHSKTAVPADGQREYYDDSAPGFGVRVTSGGSRTYFVAYRFGGKPCRYTIGPAETYKADDARQAALDAHALVKAGRDPNEDRRARVAAQLAAQVNRPITVKELVVVYLERRVKTDKLRSAKELERLFDLHVVPKWGDKAAREITRAHVIRLMDAMRANKLPVQANRVLAALRTMFSWAIVRDHIDTDPCFGVERPTKEAPRDRLLTDAELRLVWQACAKLTPAYAAAFRTLILTGQRRTETCGAAWDDIDLERRQWTIPALLSKNGKAHDVPLSDLAVETIKAAPRLPKSEVVFTTNGVVPVGEFVRSKKRLDAEMLRIMKENADEQDEGSKGITKVPHWTLHDLRRTAASGMARLGVDPHIIEKVLNHTPRQISGVAAIYNRHGYDAEKRAALDTWARHVALLVGKGGASVIPFPGAQRATA